MQNANSSAKLDFATSPTNTIGLCPNSPPPEPPSYTITDPHSPGSYSAKEMLCDIESWSGKVSGPCPSPDIISLSLRDAFELGNVAMTDVLEELRQWASKLPFWEQAALDKILAGDEITDDDCDQLLQYLLEDAGLDEATSERPELRHLKVPDTEVGATSEPVKLVSISNLQNVNALVTDQTLTFSPVLTTIYGWNGSGKSGYARVIGCAGFTRGDDYVLPDVTQPIEEGIKPSAEMEITVGDETRVIKYEVESYHPELGCFYMLDSAAAQVHLTESNTITFSPRGLSTLTELAKVTDRVRDRLQMRIDREVYERDFSHLFQGNSDVKELIVNLDHDTDLETLRQKATLTEAEQKQLEELDIEIAQLKSTDASKQMEQLQQAIEDLETLSQRIKEAEQALSDEVISTINQEVRAFNELQSLEQEAGVEQFTSEHFTQTGSQKWLQFIRAARDLAQAEHLEGEPYPKEGDHCLLCQQSLSENPRALIHRLWKFLEADVSEKLNIARTNLGSQRQTLVEIDLDFFDDQSVSYRHLQEHDEKLLGEVSGFLETCRQRLKDTLAAIDKRQPQDDLVTLPDKGTIEIVGIIERLREEHKKLEERDVSQKIEELTSELVNLQHRTTLAKHLSEIEEYVQKLVWARKANKAKRSTSHITKEHGRLFSELVTERYIEIFKETLDELGCSLKVGVATTGRKGKRFKELTLQVDPSAPDIAKPDKVLSEGEKRAVALADFLTEVALDEGCTTIVLDDPVTSLDTNWKHTIASRVVGEAQKRQVIVFTHDLPFLYLIKKYAEQVKIDVASHWIKRGEEDDKPGYVWLNNSPALERDYRKTTKAREWYDKARKAPPEEQETLLKTGFGALRTNYEAFIILEMLNEVVQRFDDRISPGRLKGIVWDPAIVDEVDTKYGLISRYVEGHWHGDISPTPTSTPKMLLEEIEAFEALRKKLNKLKEAKKKT